MEDKSLKETSDKVQQTMLSSFIVNLLLVLVKITIGFIGHSKALVADGIHSLSDLITDVVAIIGNLIAKKPADSKHPYGHGKSEYITSLIIGIMIMLAGFILIYQMIEAPLTIPSNIVIYISIVAIVVKLIISNHLLTNGKKYNNNILLASGKESQSDVISSIIVLLSVVLIKYEKYYSMFKYTDKIASVIVGLFIIKVGFDIVKENTSMTVGEQVIDEEYLININNLIYLDSDVIEINNLVILKYGPYYKLVGNIGMTGTLLLQETHDKIDIIESKIKDFDNKIRYVTLHMYPYVKGDNSHR